MEFGSSQRDYSLDKAKRARQSNRLLGRKPTVLRVQEMLKTSSDDDDEIMLMENTGKRKTASEEDDKFEQLLGQQKGEIPEEQRLDNLLKELGLYEEGLSTEQKQELLQVVEASKASAEEEATMRSNRSGEWPSEGHAINGKNKDAKESLPSSTSRSTSSSQEGKKTNLVAVRDSDEDTRMTPSQDLFPSLHSDPEQVHNLLLSQEKMQEQEEDSYGSFPAGQQTSEDVYKSVESSARPRKYLLNRLGKRGSQDRRTSAMETAMVLWTSQVAAVVSSLVRKTKGNLSDKVPYFCPLATNPSLYTKVILRDMNDYHVCLRKVQRREGDPMPWGDPISLGKSRLLGQHCSKNVPSTSAEEPLEDPAQTLLDLDAWPVGHLETRPVEDEKAVQISETSKEEEPVEDVFASLNEDYGSAQNDDASKILSGQGNQVTGPNEDEKRYVIENTSVRRTKLSLDLESEFEIVPLTLDDKAPEERTLTGGASPPRVEDNPEIKPKQLRKRNRNSTLVSSPVCIEKKRKRQVKDKFSSQVKR